MAAGWCDVAAGARAHQSRNADALAALDQHLGEGEGDHQCTLQLGVAGERGIERHRRRAVGPQPDRMGGLPFLLAHIEMVVAGGAAPVDAAGRFAGGEPAILPEILARPGAAPSVQAMNDRRGDAARLEDQPRHGCGERATGADRSAGRLDFLLARRRRHRHLRYPIRALISPITCGMVIPSARAEKVSAMRCLRIGSASASTSSTDGA